MTALPYELDQIAHGYMVKARDIESRLGHPPDQNLEGQRLAYLDVARWLARRAAQLRVEGQ